MKLVIGLMALSMIVMAVMIFQTVLQELDLHEMKTRMLENSVAVKRKEETIADMKIKIKDMKTTLVSVSSNIEQLKKQKADSEKSTKDFIKVLQTCNTDKGAAEKKEADAGEAMAKLKADHVQAKIKAEEDIRNLKQQILDRDKALCTVADTTKEEARKLCGISEAPK